MCTWVGCGGGGAWSRMRRGLEPRACGVRYACQCVLYGTAVHRGRQEFQQVPQTDYGISGTQHAWRATALRVWVAKCGEWRGVRDCGHTAECGLRASHASRIEAMCGAHAGLRI